jgi:hypothetical protein
MTMVDSETAVTERLARLAAQTASVRPSVDFAARVMGQVELSRGGGDWLAQVVRLSKLGVVVASLAAAAGLALAWQNDDSADREEALAYGVMEVFE